MNLILNSEKTLKKQRLLSPLLIFFLLCFVFLGSLQPAIASKASVYQAKLSVHGQGVAANSAIILSTGPKQSITTQSDKKGHFTFSNLQYSSAVPLRFQIELPPHQSHLSGKFPKSQLEFIYDPKGSVARITGLIGASSTMTLDLKGSTLPPQTQIAGKDGYVTIQSRTDTPLLSGRSDIFTSIVSAGEVCCPSMIVPAPPIQLNISSVAISPKSHENPEVNNPTRIPAQPIVVPQKPKTVAPAQPIQKPQKENPKPSQDKDEKDKKPQKNIPYLIDGSVHFDSLQVIDSDFTAAISFTTEDYDRTYVGGLKRMTDDIRNAISFHISSLGAFIDSRNFMDTMRSLQNLNVNTMKDYTVSDKVCEFGTLSRSLALSEDTTDKSRLAFTKFLLDRHNQQRNTIYGQVPIGIRAMQEDFQKKYCDIVDNAGFLEGYCLAAANNDLIFNRDIDFTRVFDVPLTFDADFTSPTQTTDSTNLFALFHNLTFTPAYSTDEDEFDVNRNLMTTQDGRSILAARQVASNSFGALVGERVRTDGVSANYMKAVLNRLGLMSALEVDKYLGRQPSYFAQMEMLTKKMYQDPAFYANLYDSPANVDRQKLAMKAIELQQERDLLESLRRREMLLSTLLNLKTIKDVNRAGQSAVVSGQ